MNENERRSETIAIRLTPIDYRKLHEAARILETTPSHLSRKLIKYMHNEVTDHINTMYLKSSTKQDYSDVSHALNKAAKSGLINEDDARNMMEAILAALEELEDVS